MNNKDNQENAIVFSDIHNNDGTISDETMTTLQNVIKQYFEQDKKNKVIILMEGNESRKVIHKGDKMLIIGCDISETEKKRITPEVSKANQQLHIDFKEFVSCEVDADDTNQCELAFNRLKKSQNKLNQEAKLEERNEIMLKTYNEVNKKAPQVLKIFVVGRQHAKFLEQNIKFKKIFNHSTEIDRQANEDKMKNWLEAFSNRNNVNKQKQQHLTTSESFAKQCFNYGKEKLAEGYNYLKEGYNEHIKYVGQENPNIKGVNSLIKDPKKRARYEQKELYQQKQNAQLNKDGQEGINPSDQQKKISTQQKQQSTFTDRNNKMIKQNQNVKQGLPNNQEDIIIKK